MGTDIHIALFREDEPNVWSEVQYQTTLYDFQKEKGEQQLPDIPVAPACLRWRNYNLFSILANVRQPEYPWMSGLLDKMMGVADGGTVQSNINTGKPQGWLPITRAEDRPWPEWFSAEIVHPDPLYPEEGARDMGYHDQTYITLDELIKYPWDQESTILTGVVDAREYERVRDAGESQPDSYCGGVGGQGVKVYEPMEYEKAKAEGTLAPTPYIQMQWSETARSATGDWIGRVLPWLLNMAGGKPLMIMLGFDS